MAANYLRQPGASDLLTAESTIRPAALNSKTNAGCVQLTAGQDANESGPAAAAVALVTGFALNGLFFALSKPSYSPGMPPKADMPDSLHAALLRDRRSCGMSCAGGSCTPGTLAVGLLCPPL